MSNSKHPSLSIRIQILRKVTIDKSSSETVVFGDMSPSFCEPAAFMLKFDSDGNPEEMSLNKQDEDSCEAELVFLMRAVEAVFARNAYPEWSCSYISLPESIKDNILQLFSKQNNMTNSQTHIWETLREKGLAMDNVDTLLKKHELHPKEKNKTRKTI